MGGNDAMRITARRSEVPAVVTLLSRETRGVTSGSEIRQRGFNKMMFSDFKKKEPKWENSKVSGIGARAMSLPFGPA
jgi:hypothetical protein